MASIGSGIDSDVRISVTIRSADGTIALDAPIDAIAAAIADPAASTWVDVVDPTPVKNGSGGTTDDGVESLFRDVFGFHPLAIDDALREEHVPKLDDWGKYLFLVAQSVDFDATVNRIKPHEIDIFLGSNYLITYRSAPIPAIDRARRDVALRSEGRFDKGCDHVLYLIMDNLADDFMTVLVSMDDVVDMIQDEVLRGPTRRTLRRILWIKRAALRLHRSLSPQREVLNRLARDAYSQIDARDRVYFRDVYDHHVRLHDNVETLRDLISSALETYLSALSNRTNDVMKILTIVTVMFMPMSTMFGFFGMNFFAENLALHTRLPANALFWGSLTATIVAPVAIAVWARWKGWI